MNISKLDVTLDARELFTVLTPAVDLGLTVKQCLELGSSLFGFAHVGGEGEDSAGRLSTEDYSTKTEEELELSDFAFGN